MAARWIVVPGHRGVLELRLPGFVGHGDFVSLTSESAPVLCALCLTRPIPAGNGTATLSSGSASVRFLVRSVGGVSIIGPCSDAGSPLALLLDLLRGGCSLTIPAGGGGPWCCPLPPVPPDLLGSWSPPRVASVRG
jgi:hypothetical protein